MKYLLLYIGLMLLLPPTAYFYYHHRKAHFERKVERLLREQEERSRSGL